MYPTVIFSRIFFFLVRCVILALSMFSFQLHDDKATCTLSFSPLLSMLHSCYLTGMVTDYY